MRNCLIIIITGLLLLLTNVGFAQDKITESLNYANLIFEEGKIQESLERLKVIEKEGNLSKEQKKNLYRQMTICYIFLDRDNVFLKDSSSNMEMAQNSYLNLLNVDNIYEVDPMDIIDYVRFTEKFSSKPLIIINPMVGFNTSIVDVLQYYGTSNLGIADTSYYDLTNKSPYEAVYTNLSYGLDVDWNFYKNFNLSIGGRYTQRSYKYNENLWFGTDRSVETPPNSPFMLRFKEAQQWIDGTVKIKYNIEKSKEFVPYISGGLSYHHLLSAGIEDVFRSSAENLSVDGLKEIRVLNNYSFIGGGGFRWQVFDKHYFTFNAEYSRMMRPINKIENRYTSDVANTLNYAFGYVDNDIRLNNISLMIGFAYAFYNPKMINTHHDK